MQSEGEHLTGKTETGEMVLIACGRGGVHFTGWGRRNTSQRNFLDLVNLLELFNSSVVRHHRMGPDIAGQTFQSAKTLAVFF